MPLKDPEARKQYEHKRNQDEARRAHKREWSREYKKTDAYKAYQKRYRAEHRRLTKGTREIIVKEEVCEALWLAQNKRCAICKIEIPLRGLKTHMDHNHTTGQLRGLLCQNCNPGIGQFKDSPELLEAAAAYLRRYNGVV